MDNTLEFLEKQEQEKQRVEWRVELFNKRYKIGDTVMWRSVYMKGVSYQPYITSSEAFVHEGRAVVCFEGIAGYFSIEPGFLL